MNRPISILVVEDEPVTLGILERYFAQSGFAVVSARTGEEALILLRSRGATIDGLFTDIALPGRVDGWLVGAEFHLSYPGRPVIYASTLSRTSKARAAGAIYFLKPYSPQDVVETLRDLICGKMAA